MAINIEALINSLKILFTRQDFYSLEKLSPLFTKKMANGIIEETIEKVSAWSKIAADFGVPKSLIDLVDTNLRLNI
ncbi:hypothetical protein [Photorhabdus bodei]|uniref:hypothetical protein n=1 Tax=Photorhabdus bodei TaxID=2029681 RepID=UPI0018769CDC|nr:hypothetical protein [Photorhabdus bodei]